MKRDRGSGGKEREREPSPAKEHVDCPIVERFDWMSARIFRDLEKQTAKICGVFVITEALEAWYFLLHNEKIRVSKQELLDKCKKEIEIGKSYAYCLVKTLWWIEENGLSLEENYTRFSRVKRRVTEVRRPVHPVLRIEGVFYLYGDDEQRILKKLSKRPLVAKLIYHKRAYTRAKRFPTEAYIVNRASYEADPKSYNHAITLTGWNTSDDGTNCYLVRDPNKDAAPNSGYYSVRRASSVTQEQINPIEYVAGVKNIYLQKPRRLCLLHSKSKGSQASTSNLS